jgi:hypothetical protein
MAALAAILEEKCVRKFMAQGVSEAMYFHTYFSFTCAAREVDEVLRAPASLRRDRLFESVVFVFVLRRVFVIATQ